MGRWGDDIYDSDDALDYLATITRRVERELAFWLDPQVVAQKNYWLAEVLTVIEIILLFEQHRFGHTVFIIHYEPPEKAVRRWRDVVLGVWDAEWEETDRGSSHKGGFADPEFRKQHRPAVLAMFDRLELIAHHWANLDTKRGQDLPPLLKDLTLPYFSPLGELGRFAGDLLMQLEKDIITLLSAERREEIMRFVTTIDELWVAVDSLSLLVKAFDMSPSFNAEVIRNWRDTAIGMEKQLLADNDMGWHDDYRLYKQVFAAFDALEAAAEKRPPWW